MIRRMRRRRAVAVLVLVLSLWLVLIAGAWFLSREPPEVLPPPFVHFTISSSGPFPYNLTVPAVVFPNGSLPGILRVDQSGNATHEVVNWSGVPSIRIRGTGNLSLQITYSFTSLRYSRNSSRFPLGLPDFSTWNGTDADSSDTVLGTVRVLSGDLPAGEFLSLDMTLSYYGLLHLGSVGIRGPGEYGVAVHALLSEP